MDEIKKQVRMEIRRPVFWRECPSNQLQSITMLKVLYIQFSVVTPTESIEERLADRLIIVHIEPRKEIREDWLMDFSKMVQLSNRLSTSSPSLV